MDAASPVILFDGVCNFCNRWVQFVMRRDGGFFRFAPLQSESGAKLLSEHGLAPDYTASIVLIEDGKFFAASDAALRIAAHLRGAWPLFGALRVVPRPLRDWVYQFIAKNRYRWFGKRETCMLPSEEERGRFI